MEELIIEDKTYISSKRAAEITGYAKDYVGQLCREGRVQARLVGRSWYVLEDSIRAHKFGVEEEETESLPKAPEPEAWSTPRYVQEEAPEMPSLKEREQSPEHHSVTVKSEALSDMQEAWQEWFNHKQEEILEVVEDEIEDENTAESSIVTEEDAVSIKTPWADLENVVTLKRSHSSMPLSEPVEPVEVVMPQRRVQAVQRREVAAPVRSNGVAKAMIIALSLLVLSATAIGTGFADKYLVGNIGENPIFQFLGGQSTVNK